jgi:hypothetical protein
MTIKTRTFTVLFRDDYEFADMTDDQAIQELRDALQAACDDGQLGGNFLVLETRDGDADFWQEWRKRSTPNASQS